MRVLLDEDIPQAFAEVFARASFEVLDVHQLRLRGAVDAVIFRAAQRHHAILVTGDLGFADIRRFPPRSCAGIIVIRFPNTLTIAVRCRELRRLLRRSTPQQFHRTLTIIAPNLLRFRR
ncbi:DUF5615 family PIN-like protein [Candidatus Uhrbacteria bacterium]|nr:DUF5615 family PIN-like protein [Candidatus Uhrbacteria bacterium]